MKVRSTAIADVKVIVPRRFRDSRGWFTEAWNAQRYAELGVAGPFVQDNMAFNEHAGTIRGMHFQKPPAAQGKLVYVTEGAVLDVAVDIRHGSPTFGRHVAVTLSADEGEQLWVPEGFAHGYCTLTPGTRFLYKVTRFWDAAAESGIRFDDPDLGIGWPVELGRAIVAEKDRAMPRLSELPVHFRWESPQ